MDLSSVDYSRWAGRCYISNNDIASHETLVRYFGLQSYDHKKLNTCRPKESNIMSDDGDTSVSVVHILEIVLRPDTPTQLVMSGVAKVASVLQLVYEDIPSPHIDSDRSETDESRNTFRGNTISTAGRSGRGSNHDRSGNDSDSGSGSSGHAVLYKTSLPDSTEHFHHKAEAAPSDTATATATATWSHVDVQVGAWASSVKLEVPAVLLRSVRHCQFVCMCRCTYIWDTVVLLLWQQ